VIYGDGKQTRDFTYVSNAVDAVLLASDHADQARGQIMNVGCGERTSLNELYEFLAETVGFDASPVYDPPRPGDVRHSLADLEKAGRLIGYEPLVHIKEGLEKTAEWFMEESSGS
jgi:nucleoside-diphosphate-sugar epimerase